MYAGHRAGGPAYDTRMTDRFAVRLATAHDIPLIAQHRAEMFAAMGQLATGLYEKLVAYTTEYLEEAMPDGTYVGWLATARPDAATIVAGAGVQIRRTLPHPLTRNGDRKIASGRQAIVLNVFTEKPWRRQGLAGLLMAHVVEWARRSNVDTLVLHSSAEGRRLYERLGFVPTTEMRLENL
jgi:GNAT superfamily N-acetyltransferase